MAKRRRQKALGELLRILLKQKTEDGRTNADLLTDALFNKALTGDVRAFEALRDTIGERPGTHFDITGHISQVEIFEYPDDGRD